MLRVLNQFCHGYTLVPVAVACETGGLFRNLATRGSLSLASLAEAAGANPGPLRVALEMFEILGWVKAEEGLFSLEPKAEERKAVSASLMSLYEYSPSELVASEAGGEVLAPWLDRAAGGWDCGQPLSLLLDGAILLPVLIGIKQGALFDALKEGDRSTLPAVEPLRRVLLAKKWATEGEGFLLNGVGKFMFGRSLVGGVTVSYRPLLSRMKDMLFGDADGVLRFQGDSETHVDRTLNVQSSGFQHERFFAEMDKVLATVFAEDFSLAHPAYVADMGCGDGTLLKRVHDLVSGAGGEVGLVGLDFNRSALDETGRTLKDLSCHLLHADIARPAEAVAAFERVAGADAETVLHLRSFLDHNRPWADPEDPRAAEMRPRSDDFGMGIGPKGSLIPPEALQQSLVEHLRRWAGVVGESGLLCLEVHRMSPREKRAYFELAEGFHFDALHAFSRQYLCSPSAFFAAMAEAGLFPEGEVRKQPRGMPYTRITLGYYKPRPYAVRPAIPGDLATVCDQLGAAVSSADRELGETLIRTSPLTCFSVLDDSGRPMGVAACEAGSMDAEEKVRTVSLRVMAAESDGWRGILSAHCRTYFDLFEGKTNVTGFEER